MKPLPNIFSFMATAQEPGWRNPRSKAPCSRGTKLWKMESNLTQKLQNLMNHSKYPRTKFNDMEMTGIRPHFFS